MTVKGYIQQTDFGAVDHDDTLRYARPAIFCLRFVVYFLLCYQFTTLGSRFTALEKLDLSSRVLWLKSQPNAVRFRSVTVARDELYPCIQKSVVKLISNRW